MKKFFLNYAQLVVFDFSLFNFCDLTSFKKISEPLVYQGKKCKFEPTSHTSKYSMYILPEAKILNQRIFSDKALSAPNEI